MAQPIEHLTLDFGSGHDPRVVTPAEHGPCLEFFLSLSVFDPPLLALSLSLSIFKQQ